MTRSKDVAVGRANTMVEQAKADTLDIHQKLRTAQQRIAQLKSELESNTARQEVKILKNRIAELENEVCYSVCIRQSACVNTTVQT